MRDGKLEIIPCEQRSVEDLIGDITTSTLDLTSASVAALAQVRREIISGEGPTVAGRLHFSRTIDVDDASLCARILIAAGRTGLAVSRAEADALFAIDAAGSERRDDGRFDDLLVKAVMHHLMFADGADVPSREMALAPETPLLTWASAVHIDPELRSWLESRLGQMKPLSTAARAIVTAVSAMNFLGLRLELSLSVLFNIAA
jgi:hypothetical protein